MLYLFWQIFKNNTVKGAGLLCFFFPKLTGTQDQEMHSEKISTVDRPRRKTGKWESKTGSFLLLFFKADILMYRSKTGIYTC